MEENKDVKQEVVTPDPAKVSADTAKAEETKVESSDDNNRAIPYARFKEVIDTKKDLEKKLKQMEKLVEEKVNETAIQQQTYYEGEIAKMRRQLENQDPYATEQPHDPYAGKVTELQKTIESLSSKLNNLYGEREVEKLNHEIGKLKDVYPDLDDEHVLSVKKLKPDWSLEECAEYSHKKYNTLVKEKVNKILESKKEAAKKPVLVADGRISLKPEEKPKTFKEAKQKMMEYYRQRGQI